MKEMRYPFLWIAADALTKKESETLEILREIAILGYIYPGKFGIKINLDFIAKRGLGYAVDSVRQFNLPVFTDFKMWNGGRTMADLVDELVQLGVAFVNVYAEAGGEIEKAVKRTEGTGTKILGLTVLSHYNDDDCRKKYGRTLKKAVEFFGQMAIDNGCHGIILPGTCLDVVQNWNTIKFATGGRPLWYKDDRHKQEMTLSQIVSLGADMLVCGRPIMKSREPILAFHKIMEEIKI